MSSLRRRWVASKTRIDAILGALAGELHAGQRVLDVGCGNGAVARAVADRYDVVIEGCDVIDLREFELPFRLIGDRLPYADRSFEVAMLNNTLAHIVPSDQGSTIAEAMRVADRVLIFETYPTLLGKFADIVMGWVVYSGKEAVPLSHRDPPNWMRLIGDLGWTGRWRHIPTPGIYPLRHFAISISPLSDRS